MEKKDLIYIFWLSLLTIPYIGMFLYNVFDSFYDHFKKKKELAYVEKSLGLTKVSEINDSKILNLEKYLEIDAIDKFKETIVELMGQLSESQKCGLMSECVKHLNLELVTFLHEEYKINIHSQNFDVNGESDWYFKTGHFLWHNDNENALLLLKYFLDNGSDPKINDSDILYKASKFSNFKAVKLLVEYGANISACERAAILIAQKNGNDEIVNYLVEQERKQSNQKLERDLLVKTDIVKKHKI